MTDNFYRTSSVTAGTARKLRACSLPRSKRKQRRSALILCFVESFATRLTLHRTAKMEARRRSPLARNVVVPLRPRLPTKTTTRQKSPPPRRARRPQPPAPKMPPRRKVAVARRRPLLLPMPKTTPKSKLLRRRLEVVLASRSQLRRRSKKSTRSRLRPRRRLGVVLANPWPPMSKTKPRLL